MNAMETVTVNTGKKLRGKPYQPGQSGNPQGRPKGARQKQLVLLEQLLEAEGEAICNTIIEAAKDGDVKAAKIILDRLVPPKRSGDWHINIDLPEITSPANAVVAMGKITNAVAHGALTPCEAEALSKTIEVYIKCVEMCELENRISALEENNNSSSPHGSFRL
jgi:hypothetical protein